MNQIFSSSERIFTDVWSHFGNFQNAGKRWPKRYSVNPPLGWYQCIVKIWIWLNHPKGHFERSERSNLAPFLLAGNFLKNCLIDGFHSIFRHFLPLFTTFSNCFTFFPTFHHFCHFSALSPLFTTIHHFPPLFPTFHHFS